MRQINRQNDGNMFQVDNISQDFLMECSKRDDERQVRQEEEKKAQSRLKEYNRKLKKVNAGMIRTEEMPPSEKDLKLLDFILEHNKKH